MPKASRIALLVGVQAVRRNLRHADHALAQVLNEIVRGLAVALAGAIADDRPRGGGQRDIGVLVAQYGRRGAACLSADCACGRRRPTARRIRSGEREGRPSCGRAIRRNHGRRERQARDRLAVGVGEAAHGALADAFTERGDDFNLLVARKDCSWRVQSVMWRRPEAWLWKISVRICYIRLSGHDFGAQSRG